MVVWWTWMLRDDNEAAPSTFVGTQWCYSWWAFTRLFMGQIKEHSWAMMWWMFACNILRLLFSSKHVKWCQQSSLSAEEQRLQGKNTQHLWKPGAATVAIDLKKIRPWPHLASINCQHTLEICVCVSATRFSPKLNLFQKYSIYSNFH